MSATDGNTYKTLLDAGYDKFTAPFFGGFDGLNIKLPDPFYNGGMAGATVSELSNASYYTIKRAIDTLSDPEFVDINLMTMPGLTQTGLTEHMINVCEERADAMALIDLPDLYKPTHEQFYPDRNSRILNNPQSAATSLRNRRIDSSYGCHILSLGTDQRPKNWSASVDSAIRRDAWNICKFTTLLATLVRSCRLQPRRLDRRCCWNSNCQCIREGCI